MSKKCFFFVCPPPRESVKSPRQSFQLIFKNELPTLNFESRALWRLNVVHHVVDVDAVESSCVGVVVTSTKSTERRTFIWRMTSEYEKQKGSSLNNSNLVVNLCKKSFRSYNYYYKQCYNSVLLLSLLTVGVETFDQKRICLKRLKLKLKQLVLLSYPTTNSNAIWNPHFD